jgi:N-methylhydantoinase A
VIEGPAIIIEMDSTTLVEHDCRAIVDRVGNILITLKAES